MGLVLSLGAAGEPNALGGELSSLHNFVKFAVASQLSIVVAPRTNKTHFNSHFDELVKVQL